MLKCLVFTSTTKIYSEDVTRRVDIAARTELVCRRGYQTHGQEESSC